MSEHLMFNCNRDAGLCEVTSTPAEVAALAGDEWERRQLAYHAQHGDFPPGAIESMMDVMEWARREYEARERIRREAHEAADEIARRRIAMRDSLRHVAPVPPRPLPPEP